MRQFTPAESQLLVLAAVGIAVIATINGWARAARAENRVAEMVDDQANLNGAIQALHEDLDQLRGDLRRAMEALERAEAKATTAEGRQPAATP